jgi:hypothetical protein
VNVKIKYSQNNKTTGEEKAQTEGNPATVTDWQFNLPAVWFVLEKGGRVEKRGEGGQSGFLCTSDRRRERRCDSSHGLIGWMFYIQDVALFETMDRKWAASSPRSENSLFLQSKQVYFSKARDLASGKPSNHPGMGKLIRIPSSQPDGRNCHQQNRASYHDFSYKRCIFLQHIACKHNLM